MASLAHDILAEIEQRRIQLNANLLKVYNYYRVFVGLALLAMFLQHYTETRLGRLRPDPFLWVTLFYIASNLLSAVLTQALPGRWFRRQFVAVAFVLFDVGALTWLMYLSGGVSSGLGVVILVAVAAGAVLVTGRASAFLAAIATIAVLYEEFYVSLVPPDYRSDYFQAGVLGAIYFATSIAIQTLSARLRRTEITSLSRAAEVADLERVNRSIIQRMRTGIIVVDDADRPRLFNQSARSLLGLATAGESTPDLPQPLLERLRAWRADTLVRTGPFEIAPTTPEIRANFSAVRPERPDSDVIIFLEDTVEIQQHAQQLKLAALGRLSASIAHEIRNPVGAMSHAAQLLAETAELGPQERRLTEIVTGNAERVSSIIDNVLQLSRRESTRPERVAIGEWLRQFCGEFCETLQLPGAQLRPVLPSAEIQVRVDPSHLRQIVWNLVENATRHSADMPGNPPVDLLVARLQATGRPFLEVADRGPGIPDSATERIFEPFFTGRRGGTGLGLFIARELAQCNGALLLYEPRAGGGSIFRVVFADPQRWEGRTNA